MIFDLVAALVIFFVVLPVVWEAFWDGLAAVLGRLIN
jgi:hypothetical protein